jgi:DNA-binding CsgD family transcriptional regulator/PAS domain-containing protein
VNSFTFARATQALHETAGHSEDPMREAGQVLSLVGDIYDAALDPALWVDVLGKARDFVGGSAAAVFSKDARTKSLNVYYHCGGVDPHYQQLYFDEYATLDPSTSAHVLSEIEQPICTADIMALDEFTETRFYQEWGRPQGLVDFAAAVLDKTATGAALFGVFRQERHGFVDDDTRWRLRQIVPHIRRAMLIGRAIELKTAQASALADTLDGVSAGMFLVDESGRIVHANASGQALLDERSVLRAGGGKVAAIAADADRELNQSLATAGGGDAAVGVKGIAVPLTARDGERYVAHVLPLTSAERRRAGAGYAATAALFVRKAALEVPSPPETIAKLYKLTPTELRVLLAVVEIGGVPEVAEALGMGEATVKTHLHRLFAKTETARQAELVKLVAAFANPLVN